jgi:hypothetical protein
LLAFDQRRVGGGRLRGEAGVTNRDLQAEVLHRRLLPGDGDSEVRAIRDGGDRCLE